MADVFNKAGLTRPWFAGADANVDIHIEAYEGDIEGSFAVQSLFRSQGLTNFKSVTDKSNTWRGDRIGAAKVYGRRSGEDLEYQRITNEKMVVVVDTLSYIRTSIDLQDDWTAPDFRPAYAKEHGTAHAKTFDEAHIIQLIKSSNFVPPASLNGSFHPGIKVTMTGYTALAESNTKADKEAAADMIVDSHDQVITALIDRDLGDEQGLVTLISPKLFNILLKHDRLTNVQFQGGEGTNNLVKRRIAVLNGTKVIETPRFPRGARADHPLGPDYDLTAAEAKGQLIVFLPEKALVTVEAKEMEFKPWVSDERFQTNLDSFTMYNVGSYRPDAVGVVFTD